MTYDITLYCPDRHLTYDPDTPEKQGLGGGVTMRLRLARALAARGHRVTFVGNCRARTVADGVEHVPVGDVRQIRADVAIFTSTGGPPSFEPMKVLDVAARLRLGWVHGVVQPTGILDFELDGLCVVSNFVGDVVRDEWGFGGPVFVIYNGVERRYYTTPRFRRAPKRDRFRLVANGKLDAALEPVFGVLERLRSADDRYALDVVGGGGLWGSTDTPPTMPPGGRYHGTIGQRALARMFQSSGFSLSLQTIREGFGLSATEAMAGGCLPVVSAVGAFPEVVRDGVDGFLVSGDPLNPATQAEAADVIHATASDPARDAALRRAAVAMPWDMPTAAAAWENVIAAALADRGR